MDACVLIDYLKADPKVLGLFSEHFGPLYIASPILEEVKDIEKEDELIKLGIIVIEPELDEAFMSAGRPGPLSFQDRLCLHMSRRLGLTCVTNDKRLRAVCEAEGIPIMWGLELLIELHKADGISSKEAESLAHIIRESNPKHITAEILSRFVDKVREHERHRVRV